MNIREKLSKLIGYYSIANEIGDNISVINFITNTLTNLGFHCVVAEKSKYNQPCIIAKREALNNGLGSIVLYGHYDVEKIKDFSKWETNPLTLTKKEDRLYGVGIADNKGPLMARIQAVENLLKSGDPCPEILWLIQGEEEVGSEITHEIFKEPMQNSKALIFVDETAYHKNCTQEFLVGEKNEAIIKIIEHLSKFLSSKDISYEIQIRNLNKSFTPGSCPFLNNIPSGKTYFAFGPNDQKSNIHRSNESLDEDYLEHHILQFEEFLKFIAKYNI